ncbi:MAG: porin [Jannaschia sp.]
MKKILLASTALVAFAGAAAAEVTLSGNAEMGLIIGDGGVAATDNDIEFHTDIDVTFTMSGETDNGLTFGATIDLDESDGSNSAQGTATVDAGPDGIFGTPDDFIITPGTSGSSGAFSNRSQGGETIFISGGFGTLTAGDTDGALDWALTEVAFNSGSLGDDETEHAGYNGNSGLDGTYDGQIVRYDYSFGDFGFALSAEIDDNSTADPILGIGFKYTADLGGSAIGFGLGYQATEDGAGNDVDALGVSINGTVAGFAVGVSFLNRDNDVLLADSYDHVGVGIGYTTGAISMSANYGEYDYDDGLDASGFGLTAGYDLGGGASVQAGYGNSDPRTGADFDTFSFGVRLNF